MVPLVLIIIFLEKTCNKLFSSGGLDFDSSIEAGRWTKMSTAFALPKVRLTSYSLFDSSEHTPYSPAKPNLCFLTDDVIGTGFYSYKIMYYNKANPGPF